MSRRDRSGRAAQFDRGSITAGARPILAYKFRRRLPRNFPAVGYLRAPTASLEGWRGPQHLGEEPLRPTRYYHLW